MDVISRATAKELSLVRYFTGLACSRGHIAERRVSDHGCVECSRLKAASSKERDRRRDYMRDHQRNYRRAHPDRVKASRQKRDKGERAAQKRLLRAKPTSRHREVLSKSFQKHKAQRTADTRAWRHRNKAASSLHVRAAKAKRRAAEGKFTKPDIIALLASQKAICAACPSDIAENFHVDHVRPLARGGTNWPDNLQLLCPTCNRSKGRKTMDEWLEWRRLYAA
jgi:5-methylcytosine-specific restriction endonuclease McrA